MTKAGEATGHSLNTVSMIPGGGNYDHALYEWGHRGSEGWNDLFKSSEVELGLKVHVLCIPEHIVGT